MQGRIRLLSLAGMMGGVGVVVMAFLFAFTHGTTSLNKMESVLGLNEVDWGRVGILVPLLLWAGLWAFGLRTHRLMGRLARWGYGLASAAMAIRLLSEIPQFLINMRTSWLTPLGQSAWFGFLLSTLLLLIGMLLLGAGNLGTGMHRPFSWAPLLLGLLILPTTLTEGALGGLSDDSTLWRIIIASIQIPLGLAWSWLSLTAWPVHPVRVDRNVPGEAAAQ